MLWTNKSEKKTKVFFLANAATHRTYVKIMTPWTNFPFHVGVNFSVFFDIYMGRWPTAKVEGMHRLY